MQRLSKQYMKRIYRSQFFLTLIPIICTLLAASCGSGSSGPASIEESDRLTRSDASHSELLGSFWEGAADFVPTGAGFGSEFQLHFINSVEHEGELRAYYVSSPLFYGRELSAATGMAISSDGVNFRDYGEVLPVGGDLLWSFYAVDDFSHPDGVADQRCSGWSAGPEHAGGYLAAGSPSAVVGQGSYTARFALTVFGNLNPDDTVILIEVYDRDKGETLATKDIKTADFPNIGTESSFTLDFEVPNSTDLELRVFSYGVGTACFRFASVQSGHGGERDQRVASFPSVVQDGNRWLMVYEGASGPNLGIHGELRLASSQDGIAWQKDPRPLLQPSAPWQNVNVGTPLLLKHDGNWFLFYHGFDGQRLQLGAAAGPSLDSLVPVNNNQPILTTGDGWDSGTIGKRSIVYENPYYYMVYEGSTLEADFGRAAWGSGLARSQDLINWEKYPGNPIIGPTDRGFGFDGPEFIRTPDGKLHIYFRNMLGSTDRVTLTVN